MSDAKAAAALPQLNGGAIYLSDGGLETTLLFDEGIDLPHFAAFPLLDTEDGRQALTRYFNAYFDVAERDGLGLVLDTPTWRANSDWGALLGVSTDDLTKVNERAVGFVRELASGRPQVPVVVNGVIGPRGDGYVVGEAMSVSEAAKYHALQTRAFATAGAEMITAVTMTYVNEAVGVTQAAASAGLPVAISFTVETDGRLPSGQPLGEAINAVDDATGSGPAYFMVNCAHPSHFESALAAGAPWLSRVKAIRANASRMSHAELDAATELDRGDPTELASDYLALCKLLPDLRVVGGCCGTDHEHVGAISAALTAR